MAAVVCAICRDEVQCQQAVSCQGAAGAPHSICRDCVRGLVADNQGDVATPQALPCPVAPCGRSYRLGELIDVANAPGHAVEQFMVRVVRRAEAEAEARAPRGCVAAAGAVERFLTAAHLYCPGCRGAIFNWRGCIAVTCDQCRTRFCGLCLWRSPPNADAHEHARREHGALFFPMERIVQAHKDVAVMQMRTVLQGLADDDARRAVAAHDRVDRDPDVRLKLDIPRGDRVADAPALNLNARFICAHIPYTGGRTRVHDRGDVDEHLVNADVRRAAAGDQAPVDAGDQAPVGACEQDPQPNAGTNRGEAYTAGFATGAASVPALAASKVATGAGCAIA